MRGYNIYYLTYSHFLFISGYDYSFILIRLYMGENFLLCVI